MRTPNQTLVHSGFRHLHLPAPTYVYRHGLSCPAPGLAFLRHGDTLRPRYPAYGVNNG